MASSDMKLKTLYVMKILLELSDDEHYLTAADIDRELRTYGLNSDRRSIYNDIEVLERFGLDIIKVRGNRGWYVGERELELPELKILIDAVQVAKFIPSKKSESLIKKLEFFTSRYMAKKLKRHIFLGNPSRSEFQPIYISVDTIHEAMSMDCRLSFQYMEWTEKKQVRLRHGGNAYQVSPWVLMWDDEYYYLLAYDPSISDIKHYRVDRMLNVRMLPELKREGKDIYEKYRKGFSRKTFGMFGGDDVFVKLKCTNRMAGVIIDRFGQDTMMVPKDDGHFTAHVLIARSPQFFGWVASNGMDIEILEPESLREEYRELLGKILSQYHSAETENRVEKR